MIIHGIIFVVRAWFLDIRMYQLVSSPITGVIIIVISHPDNNNHYVVCPLGYWETFDIIKVW